MAEEESLLDNPESPDSPLPEFVERTYPNDDLISPALDSVRKYSQNPNNALLDEIFSQLLETMIRLHHRTTMEISSLTDLRPATRQEIYKRVHRAADMASACYFDEITLNDLARSACLSQNHFLRSFKRVFHCTPHQYLTELRLQRAFSLLKSGRRSVTNVCYDVGFQSPSSFSSLFRKRFGAPPSEVR
jgi:transcriptional regulator GlxA family with amidase domain